MIFVILKFYALLQVEKVNVELLGAILIAGTHNDSMEKVRFT